MVIHKDSIVLTYTCIELMTVNWIAIHHHDLLMEYDGLELFWLVWWLHSSIKTKLWLRRLHVKRISQNFSVKWHDIILKYLALALASSNKKNRFSFFLANHIHNCVIICVIIVINFDDKCDKLTNESFSNEAILFCRAYLSQIYQNR